MEKSVQQEKILAFSNRRIYELGWSIIWRSMMFGFVGSILGGAIIGFCLAVIGKTFFNQKITMPILYKVWAVMWQPICTVLVVRWLIINHEFTDFKLALMKKNETERDVAA